MFILNSNYYNVNRIALLIDWKKKKYNSSLIQLLSRLA